MIVMPAIDVRDGACVQLVGGSFDNERVRLPDPVAVARRWAQIGFTRLHVVDLDAAADRASNASTVDDVLARAPLEIQVGGGVRTTERVEALLARNAARVVVGTRALEDPAWLSDTARRFPRRIVVAADVRGRNVAVRGWTRTTQTDIADVMAQLNMLPLAAVLVTAIDVEGQLLGPSLELVREVVDTSRAPVIASGGVTTMEDVQALAGCGAWAAVVGMALYTETLNARDVAREWGA